MEKQTPLSKEPDWNRWNSTPNWVTPLEEEAAPGFGTGTEIEGHGQENTEDACLFSNSADLDKTYESCSPYCDKPCQIHFNLDETGSDNNDDTTGNK